MEENGWNMIRALHSATQGIPASIVDLIAVYDIIRLCAFGKTPETIAQDLEMDRSYVEAVLDEYYNFLGWEVSIPANPYTIFKTTKQDPDKFEALLLKLLPKAFDLDTSQCYRICYIYHGYKKELNKYGYG